MMRVPTLNRSALAALRRATRTPRALLGRNIGSRLREQVILRVSSVNCCPTCSAVHALVARFAGLSKKDVHAARSGAVEDERVAVALKLAELRTTGRENVDRDAIRRFESSFSLAEQQEIRAVVDLFTFMNRFTNTWESVLPGARWRRRRLGLGAPKAGRGPHRPSQPVSSERIGPHVADDANARNTP